MMDRYQQLPHCLPYHPLSELKDREGYYPNISSEQLKATNELMRRIEEESLEFNHDEEDEFLKMLRFLRARKFDVAQSFNMIKEDVKWRSQENRLKLRKETAQEVLQCDLTQIYKYFPTWIQGFDKQLRPVSYRQFGIFEIWNVLKLTTMQQLIRFHAWETEQALYSMYKFSRLHGYNIETFVLVVDAAGWNMSLATSDAFTFIKGMVSTDSDHYPERLGTMIIINAPSVLSFAWGIVQGFLDPVTKAKIRILSSREDWQPVLLQCIEKDQIPMQYGGTAPDLSAEEAILSMNPPSEDETRTSSNTTNESELPLTLENITLNEQHHHPSMDDEGKEEIGGGGGGEGGVEKEEGGDQGSIVKSCSDQGTQTDDGNPTSPPTDATAGENGDNNCIIS
jgi:hypothetical protein